VSFLYKSQQDGKKVIECVCPRRSHARFRQTRGPTFCSFSMTCRTAQEELDVVRRLKHWAAQSMKFPDKAKHQQYRAPLEDCPMDADIERMPSDREATPDRELPCRGVDDLERRPCRHGRGEASGRGAGRGRGRGGQRGKRKRSPSLGSSRSGRSSCSGSAGGEGGAQASSGSSSSSSSRSSGSS